jgi:hypothetical protein
LSRNRNGVVRDQPLPKYAFAKISLYQDKRLYKNFVVAKFFGKS